MNRIFNHRLPTFGLLALLATSSLPLNVEAAGVRSEINGTRKVMKVIHTVNLPHADQQALQDILDIKGQIYSQNPLLTPTAAITGPAPTGTENGKGIPNRYRSPYRR
jgi:hypothetical protein